MATTSDINFTVQLGTGVNSVTPAKVVYAGTACSGTTGVVGRTLTHTKALGTNSLIVVGRATLIAGAGNDYTSTGSVITFGGVAIDNGDTIMIYA